MSDEGGFSSYWWKNGQASLDTETTCKWKHTMGIYKHSSLVLFGHQGAIDKIQTSHLGGIDGLVYGMITGRMKKPHWVFDSMSLIVA